MKVTPHRFYDSVHGFIELSSIETLATQSPAMYRLRFIKQLGVAFFIYPGATHTRFEHSLGVMHLSSLLFDQIFAEHTDLFGSAAYLNYCKQLVRLGALLHDVGHLPLSHSAELDLLDVKGHERIGKEILLSNQFDEALSLFMKTNPYAQSHGLDKIKQDLCAISFGSDEPLLNLLSSLITGDFFGADRMDYLLRDSQKTALTYGKFDYKMLIQQLAFHQDSFQIVLKKDGISAMESLLHARYHMYKRLYNHPKVRCLSMHVSHVMKKHFSFLKEASVEEYIQYSDVSVFHAIFSMDQSDPHVAVLRNPNYQLFQTVALRPDPSKSIDQIKKDLKALLEKSSISQNHVEMNYGLRSGDSSSSEQLSILYHQQLVPLSSVSELAKYIDRSTEQQWVFVQQDSLESFGQLQGNSFSLDFNL